jgi:hypothetical protein
MNCCCVEGRWKGSEQVTDSEIDSESILAVFQLCSRNTNSTPILENIDSGIDS